MFRWNWNNIFYLQHTICYDIYSGYSHKDKTWSGKGFASTFLYPLCILLGFFLFVCFKLCIFVTDSSFLNIGDVWALYIGVHGVLVFHCFLIPALEVISAVLSVALIYILTAILVYEAVLRTVSQEFDIDGDVMLITAAVGVAVNIM